MSTTPQHYVMVLFPEFQLLDMLGPLDVLDYLTLSRDEAKAISLTVVAETLETVVTKASWCISSWYQHGLHSGDRGESDV